MRFTPLAAAAAVLVFSASTQASDLKLDGQVSLSKALGTPLQITLTGNPALPCLLAVDVSPGPVSVLGESVAIGMTPAMFFQAIASTNLSGLSSTTLPMPSSPSLIGSTFYLLGAVLDPTDPNGFDFSASAKMTFVLGGPETAELAGNSLPIRPFFEKVRAVNAGSSLELSVDPLALPSLAGQTADLYVVASKNVAGWTASPALVDVSSGGAETVIFTMGGIAANTFTVDNGTLAGPLGTDLGAGYDLIIDLDQNGVLSSGDIIDGYGDNPGVSVVRDTTVAGPYAVVEKIYSGGSWLDQDLYYYPSNVASLGKLPLVMISHGNGHNYQWYDHIGMHLASYGYIVVSHSNNMGPGIETASTTTLTNTDYFLSNLGALPGVGSILQGHVDTNSITWLGHSRGGEGVARAYDRIFDGTYTPTTYVRSDIRLISSIAPTDFLGTNSANPHDANYHLWVGQADSDVNGCPSSDITQCFHLHDRAENQRQSISLMGVGHGWFHDAGGTPWASGPCLLNEAKTHLIMTGYILPLVKYHIEGDWAARDFLSRQYESFHPPSAPTSDPCVEVDLQFRDSVASGKFVIDDFQTSPSTAVASSGAAVSFTVKDFNEGRMDDANSNFTHNLSDIFNGFTEASSSDTTKGAVFNVDSAGNYNLTYDLLFGDADWTSFETLSFRACQATRHPLTTGILGDGRFEIELVDNSGNASVLSILVTGAGVVEPYQRTGCGTGLPGWGNEFETFRIPLEGFTAEDANFDLSNIDKLIFRFGAAHGSAMGRYGLDDIELTK